MPAQPPESPANQGMMNRTCPGGGEKESAFNFPLVAKASGRAQCEMSQGRAKRVSPDSFPKIRPLFILPAPALEIGRFAQK